MKNLTAFFKLFLFPLLFIFSTNLMAANECATTDHTGTVSSSNLTYTNTDSVYWERDNQGGGWNRKKYYIQVASAGLVEVSIVDNTNNGDVRFNASIDSCPDYPGAGTSWSHTFNSADDFNIDVTAWVQLNQNQNYTLTVTFTPEASSEADLSITKSVDNATPNVGDNVTFTIVGTNNGPETTDVSITDTLPAGLTWVSDTDNGKNNFNCSNVGNAVTCTGTNNINGNGETVTINIVARVDVAGVLITNTANIVSTEGVVDNNLGNNSASVSLTATAANTDSDLSITKTVDNATPNVGDTVTFTITGTNNGPTTTEIEIIDTLPNGFTVTDISESKNNFSCSQSGSTITCDGSNDITQGETVTITIEGNVASAGTYTNSATIASTEGVSDPDNTNNSASATITASDGGSGGVTFPSTCPTGADEAFREFCLRQKITVPGNMVTIGNTILVAPDTGDGNDENDDVCNTYTNGAFISDATEANNNYYLCEYHDDLAEGPSTSATVDNTHIPDVTNSSVEWAGLYWQAIVPDTESVTNMNIKMKNENDAYETIPSPGYDKLDWGEDVGRDGYISYSAFKDVTAILTRNNWLDGKYTVAGIPVHEGLIPNLGSYGAWTLLIIYRNDSEKLRNFSIFDGWRRLQDTDGNR